MNVAQNADQGGMLFGQGHYDLGLEGTSLESIHDLVLNRRGGAAFRANSAGIWDLDIAVLVDCLIWNGDKIAGPHAGVGGEETAGCGLEDGHTDNIANSEMERLWRSSISKCRRQSGRVSAYNTNDFGSKFNWRVG